MANLFLDEIDEQLSQNGHKYIRYADNYLLLGKNPAKAKKGLNLSMQMLEKIHLDLEIENVSSFEKGFQYLGVFFLNDMIFKPFDSKNKENIVPIFPKPFDMKAWLNHKE